MSLPIDTSSKNLDAKAFCYSKAGSPMHCTIASTKSQHVSHGDGSCHFQHWKCIYTACRKHCLLDGS